jgi:hypothetical protein
MRDENTSDFSEKKILSSIHEEYEQLKQLGLKEEILTEYFNALYSKPVIIINEHEEILFANKSLIRIINESENNILSKILIIESEVKGKEFGQHKFRFYSAKLVAQRIDADKIIISKRPLDNNSNYSMLVLELTI